MINRIDNQQDTTPKTTWLQHLKEASWEAELLVSTVAIYAILQSFTILDWLLIQFIDRLDPSQYFVGYFILIFGYLAIGILAAMFAMHFALRAYWIGLVGLNSVFPDYGLEDSAYSPIYTKKILGVLPKISDSITKIDELCSVIFSAAFAFMMIYTYGMITSSLYLIVFNILEDVVPTWVLYLPVALIGLLFIFGLLISIPANMKKFHNNERIQHLYFLYARWGAIIMYGPINKSVLQITMLFGSNFKKKKGLIKMVLMMLFMGIIFGMTQLVNSNYRYLIINDASTDASRVYNEFYATHNEHLDYLLGPEIPSEIIKEDAINLFIPVFDHETDIMGKDCELSKFDTMGKDNASRQARWKANLDCYSNRISVFLDDEEIQVPLLKRNHASSDQFGLQGFVDVHATNPGPHRLKIVKKVSKEIRKEWEIPFYLSLGKR